MNIRFVFLFLLIPLMGKAQPKDLSADLVSEINLRIDNETYPGVVIGILDKNGPRYYAFGTKKLGGSKTDEHTIYEIGSISKTFTGILLADEITKGKMKADDPISKYLPAQVSVPTYPGDDTAITLGHLSDHTSSLPRLPSNLDPKDPANPYADYTVEMMYDFLSGYTLTRPVGSQFEYSNLAVGLLGYILGLNAKTTYEDLLSKKLTAPLKMKETGIALIGVMKNNLATPYAMGLEVANWDLSVLGGAGGIRSSAADMLIYLSANIGLTKSKLYPAMELSHQARHDKAGNSSIGLGWFVTEGSQGDVIWHSGGTGGYRTFAGFVIETGRGVVVLTNSDVGVDDIGFHLLDPEVEIKEVRPQMAVKLRQIIDTEGAGGLEQKFMEIKATDTYDIDEGNINMLGYHYMGLNEVDAALVIFKINISEFPQSSNVYDSYGEALLKNGQQEEAVLNYKKSLELNPGNANAVSVLEGLGVVVELPKVDVDEAILETYVGIYELVEGFNIEITRSGSQLYGQATGQQKFELFAKSETEFYLTLVDAQVVFGKDADDQVMMTLYQGGQVLPGKRL